MHCSFTCHEKATKLCKHDPKNKWMNKKQSLFFHVRLRTQVSKSKPAAVLMNPDDFGLEKRTRWLSVSCYQISIYISPPWNPTFHLPHAEVNLCSCQHFLHLETGRRAQKACLRDTLGHRRTRKTQSKYSHKLTKVDTGTDVFDKFPAFVHV